MRIFALTIESGGMARVDEESIARIERGLAGVMRHLGMRRDGPPPAANPVWIDRNEVVRAGATGLFYGAVRPGDTVIEGAVIGRITDFHGRTLETIRAPFAGEVLYIIGTPAMTRDEPVAFIGERQK